MHFRKGYPIKRPWTFCPHLVQSLKAFGDLQWHWTFYPVPSKPSCQLGQIEVVVDKMELLTKYTKAISYGIIEKSTKGWPECSSKSTW